MILLLSIFFLSLEGLYGSMVISKNFRKERGLMVMIACTSVVQHKAFCSNIQHYSILLHSKSRHNFLLYNCSINGSEGVKSSMVKGGGMTLFFGKTSAASIYYLLMQILLEKTINLSN